MKAGRISLAGWGCKVGDQANLIGIVGKKSIAADGVRGAWSGKRVVD